MPLSKIKPIIQSQELILIEKKREIGDIYTFKFKSKDPIKWKSGQYLIFTIPTITERPFRVFSIASCPKEQEIMISTKITDNPSNFKQKLLKLSPNETIKVRGPLGEFIIEKDIKEIVGIAGGIGITPFRALLHEIYNQPINKQNTPTKIHLIYSEDNKEYAYKKELQELQKSENISITYTSDLDEFTKSLNQHTRKYKDATYYLSGPPKMVNSVKETLKKKHIEKIKADIFNGY